MFFFSLYFWIWHENIYFLIFDIFDILKFLWYLILFFLMISYWGSSSFTICLTDWNYIYYMYIPRVFMAFQFFNIQDPHILTSPHAIHEVQNISDQIFWWKKSFSRCPSAAPALWGKFLKESHLFIDHPSPLHTYSIFGLYYI